MNYRTAKTQADVQGPHGGAPLGQRHAIKPTHSAGGLADRALQASARFWFLVASAGLTMFAIYVMAFYGGAAWRGDLQGWNKVLPSGYVAGKPLGNGVLASHLLLAVFVTLGGAIQLLPQIRARAPHLHRWIGRSYLVAVALTSLGGTYLIWTRGTVGDLSQHVAITVNAAVILVCGAMAWRHARARRLDLHRRWALRLFLAANGVWFFRVGLMLWLLVFQRPVGFDPKTFSGPFLSILAFAQFLLPLALLEIYLRARESSTSASVRLTTAIGLGLLTVAMGLGIFGAVMGMWLPRI